MSGLDSWEDDPAAQDEGLSQHTQNLNLQGGRGNSFTPNASSFQPGAQSFQPGQSYQQSAAYNQSQQYGQHYNQQSQYNGGYPQYGQQSYSQYSQVYTQQPTYDQNYAAQSQQPSQQRQVPMIAKRPSATDPKPFSSVTLSGNAASSSAPPVKTLSIGSESAGAAAPKTKVLSLGTSGLSPAAAKEVSAEEGAKNKTTQLVENSGGSETIMNTNGTTSPPSGRSSPVAVDAQVKKRDVDTVAKEQAAQVDEETLEEVYGKEHVNIIFIGHVDAGKSTLGGSILYATGVVDERTIEKYKREAKDAGRESWYLSWALDLTKEERTKGKTVEVGRGYFETEKRRYSILDAPGHKTFVPSMLTGASQADVGILVISARKGEYETGFEKGGQTREHAILAKTQGVNKLCIVVNKMDDLTVNWSKDRYNECTQKLTNFLVRQVGYSSKNDLTFMPISAQTTMGIKDRVPKDLAPWYDGPSLLEYLDDLKTLERKVKAPFMMPISFKYKDMGTIIEGKIEAGQCKKGSTYIMMPNREEVTIVALYGETEEEITTATCGDQVRARIRGVEEEDILPGFVLCSASRPCHCVASFEAEIALLELKTILSAGYNAVMHCHSLQEEITFSALLHKLEKGTRRKSKKAPAFGKQGMSIVARLDVVSGAGKVCVERYEDYPQLGRFTLRDQGQTIAIGKITRLITDSTT